VAAEFQGRSGSGRWTYLNSRPLCFCLEELAPRSQVIFDLPSRLADGLADGRLDVALVPSIEHFRQLGSTIVSDACVACEGPVRSVRLYSRVPAGEIRTLALDEGSRTSAALTRILLADRFGVRAAVTAPADRRRPGGFPGRCDAGNWRRGMLPAQGPLEFAWDLGEEWCRWTGLPFVFAMWVARPGLELAGLDPLFAAARDHGFACLEAIACEAASTVGLPAAECLDYLRTNLHFRLGPRERSGLAHFCQLAARQGLARQESTLSLRLPRSLIVR